VKREAIVAIDGPAASGKSTTAKMAAEEVGYLYLDTGAMYRAVTLKALRLRAPVDDEISLARLAGEAVIDFVAEGGAVRVFLDGEDVTDAIRSPDVDAHVSLVSSFAGVRRELVAEQRRMARDGGIVCEGRDIGTVVLPDADLKFFIEATLDERARRRQKDLIEKGTPVTLEQVEEHLDSRDRFDSEREESPLTRAPDAVLIDTTALTIPEQVALVVDRIRKWQRAAQRGASESRMADEAES
jgi:cytidylate kinase